MLRMLEGLELIFQKCFKLHAMDVMISVSHVSGERTQFHVLIGRLKFIHGRAWPTTTGCAKRMFALHNAPN